MTGSDEIYSKLSAGSVLASGDRWGIPRHPKAGKQEVSSEPERRRPKCRQGAAGVTPSPGRMSTEPLSGSGPDVQTARGLNTDHHGTPSEPSAEGP